MQNLIGKKALVTAASRGIGRAIAERLAAAGAHEAINYVGNEGAATAAADAIRESGGEASLVRGDMGDLAEITRVSDAATSGFD